MPMHPNTAGRTPIRVADYISPPVQNRDIALTIMVFWLARITMLHYKTRRAETQKVLAFLGVRSGFDTVFPEAIYTHSSRETMDDERMVDPLRWQLLHKSIMIIVLFRCFFDLFGQGWSFSMRWKICNQDAIRCASGCAGVYAS